MAINLGKIFSGFKTAATSILRPSTYTTQAKLAEQRNLALQRMAATKAQARTKGITSKTTTPQLVKAATAPPPTAFTLPGGGGGGGAAAVPALDLFGLRTQLAEQLGLSRLREQLAGVTGQAEKERGLLEKLPEDIRERSGDFLMSSARRRRLESSERAPIYTRYQELLRQAQPLEGQLRGAESEIEKLLSLAIAEQRLKQSAAKGTGGAAKRLQTVTLGNQVYQWNPYTGALGEPLGPAPAKSSGYEETY